MSVVILFAILFQSIHSFEHLTKQLTEKKCLHKHTSIADITHEHKVFDKCFTCEFAFSSFISTSIQSFVFANGLCLYNGNSYFLKESVHYYSGISYSLRGPPIV